MADNLLTPAQAGHQLGMTVAAMAQLRYLGKGPQFVKLTGRAIRYRQADIDSYVTSRMQSSTRS